MPIAAHLMEEAKTRQIAASKRCDWPSLCAIAVPSRTVATAAGSVFGRVASSHIWRVTMASGNTLIDAANLANNAAGGGVSHLVTAPITAKELLNA